MGEGARGRGRALWAGLGGLAGLVLVAGCAVQVVGPPEPGPDGGTPGGPDGGTGRRLGDPSGPTWSELRILGPSTGWQPIFVGALTGGEAVVIGQNTFGGVKAVRAWIFESGQPVLRAGDPDRRRRRPQSPRGRGGRGPGGGPLGPGRPHRRGGARGRTVHPGGGVVGAGDRRHRHPGDPPELRGVRRRRRHALATWDDAHAASGATFNPQAGWTPLPRTLAATWVTPTAAPGGGGVVSWAVSPASGACVVRAVWVAPGTGFGAPADLGPDNCGEPPTVGIGTAGQATAAWLGPGSLGGIRCPGHPGRHLVGAGAPRRPHRHPSPRTSLAPDRSTPGGRRRRRGGHVEAGRSQTYLPQVLAARYRPGAGWTKETRVSGLLEGALALSGNTQGQALVAWETASLGTLGNVAISDGAPDGTWSAETDLDWDGPVHAALGDAGDAWVFPSGFVGLRYTYRPPP